MGAIGIGTGLWSRAMARAAKTPPALPTPTTDMLPALTTSGASWAQVVSTERILSSYGPTAALAVLTDSSGTPGNNRDVGANKTGISASDLPYTISNLVGFYDQSPSGCALLGPTTAQQPRMQAGVAVGAGRLAAGFYGQADLGPQICLTSAGGGTLPTIPLQDRTELFVIYPGVSAQKAMWRELANGAGAVGLRVLYTDQPGIGSAAAADQAKMREYGVTLGTAMPSQPLVVLLVENASGVTLWVNGVKGTTSAPPTASGTIGRIMLGAAPATTSGDAYDGRMAIAAYGCINKAINDADAAAISAAMIARFGIEAAYTLNLLYVGDSIDEGVSASGNLGIGQAVRPLLNAKTRFWNLGIAGKTLAQCYRDRASYEGALFAGGKTNVVFLQAGSNDIVLSGTSGVSLYANTLAPYVAYLKGLGYKVAVGTILPRSDAGVTTSTEAERNAYNTLVRANSAGADAVIDRATEGHMGVYPTSSNDATLYVDKVHPTTLGYSYLAPVDAAAINALL